MNNPVDLLRRQIQTQVSGDEKQTGPTKEEIAKELERLRALHEGWLKHPITIQILQTLELNFYNAQKKAFSDAKMGIDSTKMIEAAILDDTIQYIRTLI